MENETPASHDLFGGLFHRNSTRGGVQPSSYTSSESIETIVGELRVPKSRVTVASKPHVLHMCPSSCPKLNVDSDGVTVTPSEEVVELGPAVEVVEEDGFVVAQAVKVDIARCRSQHGVESRVKVIHETCFAKSGRSPDDKNLPSACKRRARANNGASSLDTTLVADEEAEEVLEELSFALAFRDCFTEGGPIGSFALGGGVTEPPSESGDTGRKRRVFPRISDGLIVRASLDAASNIFLEPEEVRNLLELTRGADMNDSLKMEGSGLPSLKLSTEECNSGSLSGSDNSSSELRSSKWGSCIFSRKLLGRFFAVPGKSTKLGNAAAI